MAPTEQPNVPPKHINPPTKPIQETITGIDSLVDKAGFKLTKERLQELAKVIKFKYGVDINEKIFEITRDELDSLKTKLAQTSNPELTWEDFLYSETVELKLRKEGRNALNLDIVTIGIENDSSRLKDLKLEADKLISKMFKDYDFLDENTKGILKLAISNKLLNSPISGDVIATLKNIGEYMGKVSKESVENIDKKEKKESKDSSNFQATFEPILLEYTGIFESLNKEFTSGKGKDLSVIQKQAVVSNHEFFRNPELIEKGASAFDINNVDFENTVLKNPTEGFNLQEIKKYILKSRLKVESIAGTLELGKAFSTTIYDSINNGGFIGLATEKFVEFILKLPIIGALFAILLGLDPENALEQLRENAKNYKLFKALKGLGTSIGKDGRKIEGKGIFKKIDLSSLNFDSMKDEIKELKKILPDLKEENYEEFFLNAFSDGYEINGYNFVLPLDDNQKNSMTLGSSDIKNSITDGLKNYNDHLTQEDLKEKEAKRLEKESQISKDRTNTETALGTLKAKLDVLTQISQSKFEDISSWNSVQDNRIWKSDINRVSIKDILDLTKNQGNDFSGIIKESCGESNFKKLSPENLKLINELFSLLREFITTKKINFDKTVEEFFDDENLKKQFLDFVESKKGEVSIEKKSTEEEKLKLDGEAKKLKLQQDLINKINEISQDTSLISGIEFGTSNKISFNRDTQEIKIGEEKYKISLSYKESGIKLNDIIVTKDNFKFIPNLEDNLILKTFYKEESSTVDKNIVKAGILELLSKGDYTYKRGEITLKIEKVKN